MLLNPVSDADPRVGLDLRSTATRVALTAARAIATIAYRLPERRGLVAVHTSRHPM